MAGIAGDDDLDTPPDATTDPVAARLAVDAGQAPNSDPAALRQRRLETGTGIAPPIQVKLGGEESAAIRAELIREIESLAGDDLQSRAIAILTAKNRLSADVPKRSRKPSRPGWPNRSLRQRF
jgi:hypothetical protein